MERGGDANAANRRGCAPLAVAAALGEEECARVLLENGADVNHQVGMQMKRGRGGKLTLVLIGNLPENVR